MAFINKENLSKVSTKEEKTFNELLDEIRKCLNDSFLSDPLSPDQIKNVGIDLKGFKYWNDNYLISD